MKWSDMLARTPLPMLALAAAWGVYEFQLLFVPWQVAVISAAAFELTYIALAFVATPDPRRASAISVAAVVVSVAYNTLAALFARRPALLDAPPLWGDVALAVLHGLPLAVVAYNVAALLLHATPRHDAAPAERGALQVTQAVQVNVAPVARPALADASAAPVPALADGAVTGVAASDASAPAVPAGISKTARVKALAAGAGVSESAMWRRVKRGEVEL